MYSDYSFLFLNSSEISSTFSPMGIHTLSVSSYKTDIASIIKQDKSKHKQTTIGQNKKKEKPKEKRMIHSREESHIECDPQLCIMVGCGFL